MKGWFMPCLLRPSSHVTNITADFLRNCSIWPFLFRFTGNTVPLGQFTSLLVRLCVKKWRGQLPWELDEPERYRNQVTFLTDMLLKVKLTARPQFIELQCVLVEDSSEVNKEERHAFCFEAMQHVTEAIKETETGNSFHYGFYCPGSLNQGETPHFSKAHTNTMMCCSRSPECRYSLCLIPPHSLMWLQDPKVCVCVCVCALS